MPISEHYFQYYIIASFCFYIFAKKRLKIKKLIIELVTLIEINGYSLNVLCYNVLIICLSVYLVILSSPNNQINISPMYKKQIIKQLRNPRTSKLKPNK